MIAWSLYLNRATRAASVLSRAIALTYKCSCGPGEEVEGRLVERSSVLLRDRYESVALSVAELEPVVVLLMGTVVGRDSWQGRRSGNVGGFGYHAGDEVNEGVGVGRVVVDE